MGFEPVVREDDVGQFLFVGGRYETLAAERDLRPGRPSPQTRREIDIDWDISCRFGPEDRRSSNPEHR